MDCKGGDELLFELAGPDIEPAAEEAVFNKVCVQKKATNVGHQVCVGWRPGDWEVLCDKGVLRVEGDIRTQRLLLLVR